MSDKVPPTVCDRFANLVQAALDRDRPLSDLDTDHVIQCEACRDLAAAARMLSANLEPLSSIAVPADFIERIVPVVAAERSRERLLRRGVMAGLASLAATVMAVFFGIPRGQDPAVAIQEPASSALIKPPPVEHSLREAGLAFANLTKRTAQESIAPARNLLKTIDWDDEPTAAPQLPKESASPVETVAPITNTARRAIDLFIRDVGSLAPTPPRKS